MRAFSGCEPLVGEIVGLRTFRVEESGWLLPLYSNRAWYDGPNAAACAPPTGEPGHADHPVPDPDCECGFYAYGSAQAATHHRQARYVQAVVSCWGGVIAGSQGIRAEHARVDAIWLHPNVAPWTRRRVAATYPSAAIYADRAAMLAEHPLTALDCYEPSRRPPLLPRAAAALTLLGLFILGLLPASLLRGSGVLWTLWVAAASAVGGLTLWLLVASRGIGHRAAAVVTAEILAWLVAPLCGPAGWLLRIPVLRGVLVTVVDYLRALRPGYFPVVPSERQRTFCGVRA